VRLRRRRKVILKAAIRRHVLGTVQTEVLSGSKAIGSFVFLNNCLLSGVNCRLSVYKGGIRKYSRDTSLVKWLSDIRVHQYPEDEDRDGPRNVGFFVA
jgi:hypothetical protein